VECGKITFIIYVSSNEYNVFQKRIKATDKRTRAHTQTHTHTHTHTHTERILDSL